MQDEMQDAGRILLMPKGYYSADATYEMLDLVNHGGESWVCKKECTGQEPSDSNTEFWQRFGTAVDLSNYAPLSRVVPQKMSSGTDLNTCVKTGVYYFGGLATDYTNTPNDSAHNGVMIVNTFNENATDMERIAQLYFSPNQNKFYFRTALGSVTAWKPWQEVFTTSGGTVATDGTTPLRLKNNTADYLFLQMQGKSGVLGYFAMNGVNKPVFITADSTVYDILHTGNKPTGTYTGNGDATNRIIKTDGIGNVLAVYRTGEQYIVMKSGTLKITSSGVSFTTVASFNDGVLGIASDSVLNTNGETYNYQVL